jgi:hypothetical protein
MQNKYRLNVDFSPKIKSKLKRCSDDVGIPIASIIRLAVLEYCSKHLNEQIGEDDTNDSD